jgi:hypothetical protein
MNIQTDKSEDYSMLRTIYSEAWKQYDHEDNLAQSRTNVIIAVHTALIALLGIAIDPVTTRVQAGLSAEDWFLPGIAGGIMIIAGIMLVILSLNWRMMTITAQRYINLRWLPVIAIEKLAAVEEIGLASLEHAYRKFSKENPEADWYPWPETDNLSIFKLEGLPRGRTPAYSRALIILFLTLDILIVLGGGIFIYVASILFGN